jgi:hypothetical protein
MKAVAHVHWNPARADGADVRREWSRALAILVATMVCIAAVALSSAVAPVARARGGASAASDRRYWTAAERVRRDAERCAGELRGLAERHAVLTARALDVRAAVLADPSGPAMRAIEARRDAVERAADAVGALRATGATDAASEQLARAHRAADALCDAREAAGAAASAGALARRRLASAASEPP